jgi:hypothetical protein
MFSHIARMAARVPLSQFDIDLIQAQTERVSADDEASSSFLVGLSVSQGAPTGTAVLQKVKPPARRGQRSVATYHCRYLRRWLPPDTAYPILAKELNAMLADTLRDCNLVVEAGIGLRTVVSMLRRSRLPAQIRPVEVKTSAEDTYVGDAWKVGNGSLIETTRQVLQEERMVFDERMPANVLATTPPVRTIYQAILTYPFERATVANDAFAARNGEHDDLVLAVALACWYGEHCQRTFWIKV